MNFREAELKDKEFILNANKEINVLSSLNDSTFEKRIDKDLFEDRICKSIIAEIDGNTVGMVLYSYVYWANCGNGIYLSQAYVKSEYRGQGIYKQLLIELEKRENECNFITDLVGPENEGMQIALEKMKFESSDLFEYLRANDFITVLSSGNIMPVLRYYKELLGIDYIFGSNPKMIGDIINNIEISDFSGKDFKYNSCLDVINKFNVEKNEVYGIGDSIHDIKMLSLAGHTFAVAPKGNIEEHVDIVIKDDISEVIKYLQ